jgi:hypothetical protein
MRHFVSPLFAALVKLWPEVDECNKDIQANLDRWAEAY